MQQRQLDASNTRCASRAIAKALCLSVVVVGVAACSSGSWTPGTHAVHHVRYGRCHVCLAPSGFPLLVKCPLVARVESVMLAVERSTLPHAAAAAGHQQPTCRVGFATTQVPSSSPARTHMETCALTTFQSTLPHAAATARYQQPRHAAKDLRQRRRRRPLRHARTWRPARQPLSSRRCHVQLQRLGANNPDTQCTTHQNAGAVSCCA